MAAEKRGVSANIITVGWSVSMVGYSLKRILNWGKWNINKTKINFRCPVSIFQIPLSSHTRVHILFDQSKWYPCNWRKRRRLNKSLIHCSSQNTSIFISFVLGRWRALLRFSLVCFLLSAFSWLLNDSSCTSLISIQMNHYIHIPPYSFENWRKEEPSPPQTCNVD